jgi:hypothetical protein
MGQGSGVVGRSPVAVGWGLPAVGGWAGVVAVPVVKVVGPLVGNSVGALFGRRVAVAVAVVVVVAVGVADAGGTVLVFGRGSCVGSAGFWTTGVLLTGILAASGGRTREWVTAVSMNSTMSTHVERRGPAAAWEILAHPI